MKRLLTCVVLVAITPAMIAGGILGDDLYLISVGRGPGANDSAWYTTVWIHNPTESDARVAVSFLRRGQPNTAPDRQFLSVASGETLTVNDVLWDLFGEDSASGSLRFEADDAIVVSSRIYNLPGTDPAESQGQFMAGVPSDLGVTLGSAVDIPGITQPADESFRCNFAMVETGGNATDVQVSLYDGHGVAIASKTYNIRPWEPIQKNLANLGDGVTVDGGRLRIAVTAGSGQVLALASMVGNGIVSQDPSTLEMAIAWPEGGGSGDITGVYSGEGLIGGGDSGEVTLAIDTAGASAGQALVYDGSNLGWSALPGGLTLPYSGTASATGAALKITNTSTAGNAYGLRGENQSTAGAGVYGWSSATAGSTAGITGHSSSSDGTGVLGLADAASGLAVGVIGTTFSPHGAGVAAFGDGDNADFIVGGTGGSDNADNGVIRSDPRFASSDIRLESNHDLTIQLDTNNDETDERLVIAGNGSEPLFEVDGDGEIRQPSMNLGVLKAVAIVDCVSPGHVLDSWSAYDTTITVGNPTSTGVCDLDFGFPFSELGVVAIPVYFPGIPDFETIHVNCWRNEPEATETISCGTLNHVPHGTGLPFKVLIF